MSTLSNKNIEQIPPVVLGSTCDFYRTFNVPKNIDYQKISDEIQRQIPSKLESAADGAYSPYGGIAYFDGEQPKTNGKFRVVLRKNYVEVWANTKTTEEEVVKRLYLIVTGQPEPTYKKQS